MKRIKYFLLIILALVFRVNVYGANLSLDLTCPETAYPSTTIECSIKSDINDGSLKELNINYNFDKSEYSKLVSNKNYKLSNNLSTGATITGTINSGNIATLSVFINGRSKDISTISLININGVDNKNNKITANSITKEVKIIEQQVNTNTNKNILYLNDLIIEGYDINFNKNKFDYELNVEYEIKNINVSATSDYEVSGTGQILLNEGENTIVIKVSNDEYSTNYTIKVNREKKQSNIVNNDINEIKDAFKSNKDLIINLNKESDILKINKETLDIIKNKKRTLTYNILEDNEILYSFIFDGSKFKSTKNNIPLELYLTKDKNGIYISSNYIGEYPKGTTIKIKNINNYKVSNTIRLYDNDLKLIKRNLNISDNYIEFSVNNGNDYIISNKVLKINNLKNIIIIIVSIIIIIILLILWRLNKRKQNQIEIPKLKDYIEMPKEKQE